MKKQDELTDRYTEEQRIIEPLLDWFADNARQLPWRENPEPYRVWISEIMLQQTRVEAVKEYYRRFMEVLPDVESLAEVDEEVLLKLWEGLGYYSRARNLKKAAQVIVRDFGGRLPKEKAELLLLPGIGSYTAGAIASIAYGKRAAAVDGNVLRVMMRYRGSRDDISKNSVKKELEECIETIMPEEYAGAFNQSLMELGATVCLPNGAPLCVECPIAAWCQAKEENTWKEIPVKPAKKERRIEEKTVLVVETSQGILLHKRLESGLLAGLWEFPALEGKSSGEEIAEILQNRGFEIHEISDFGSAKHIFSHIEWHMQGYYVSVTRPDSPVGKNSLKKGQATENKQKYNALKSDKISEIINQSYEVSFEELNRSYSVPSAFEAYRKRLEHKRREEQSEQ